MARRKRAPKAEAAETARVSPPRRSSGWRRCCFRVLALVGGPALLLGLLELILRLAGAGYPTSFLLPASHRGRDVFVQNNQFGWRFFGPDLARLPYPLCISRSPATNSIRIIVLGGSAAKGDPDPNFGLARMLETMLGLRHEGVRFEVVNAAMTAINSHTVLPIAQGCADAQADVWVIYMGNNEVVGPFGAGTVFGQQTPPLALIRATLALKTTRTGQALDALIRRLSSQSSVNAEWQGMELFLEQQVRADDPRMAGVYRHFARNLTDILREGRRRGVGIVVSTVAVNLRDCAPFASSHRGDIPPADQARWDDLFETGVAAQTVGDTAEAAACFAKAAAVDDSFAELRFRQGQCALTLGNLPEAQDHFGAARDLDTLRFRCDSRMNDILRSRIAHRENERILLADGEAAFLEQSDHGLPGDRFFYEHVHLTLEGNWLLARTIAPQIERLLSDRLPPLAGLEAGWPSMEDCARRLGWTDWAALQGWRGILPRFNRPPFTQQFDHDTRKQRVDAVLAELSPSTQPAGLSNAVRAVEEALVIAPEDTALIGQLAALKAAMGDGDGAVSAAKRAVELLPSDPEGWSRLALALVRQQQFIEAVAAFEHAVRLNPQDAATRERLAQTRAAAGQRDEAVAGFQRLLKAKPHLGLAWLHYGLLLESMERNSEAADAFEKALANPGNNVDGRIELAGFCQSRGWFEPAAQNYVAAVEADPGNAELHVGAGQNLAAAGQLEAAQQHLAEAVRLAPGFAEAHLLHGVVLGRQGRTAAAMEEFQAALRLKPDLVDARFNLGIALIETDPAQALAHFEAVLRQDPTHASALKYAQDLRSRGVRAASP